MNLRRSRSTFDESTGPRDLENCRAPTLLEQNAPAEAGAFQRSQRTIALPHSTVQMLELTAAHNGTVVRTVSVELASTAGSLLIAEVFNPFRHDERKLLVWTESDDSRAV